MVSQSAIRNPQSAIGLRLLRHALRVIFVLAFRLRVEGRRRLPARGAYVVAANHQSVLDPVLLGLAVDGVPLQFMARRTLFGLHPLFGALITRLGAFPVDREGGSHGAFREAEKRIAAGLPVALFPEGTRTLTGELGVMRPGVALLARRAGVEVVPALIDGAFEAWPKGAILPRPRPLGVAFGRPLRPVGGETPEAFAARVGEAIAELKETVERRAP